MIVVLSGEGPTDLGACTNPLGKCVIPEFTPGPMATLVNQIIEAKLAYSVMEVSPGCYRYLSEKHLQELEQQRKQNSRSMALPGKKHAQETGYFYVNAWVLGKHAQVLAEQENDKAIAILFRDTDGTRSTSKGLWEKKWQSMTDGFQRAELKERGVPMLPKPKSEAWLLCAAKKQPYQHCAALEELSGNDNARDSAKKLLREALNGADSAAEQREWIEQNGVNLDALSEQMPSFCEFFKRLNCALQSVMA